MNQVEVFCVILPCSVVVEYQHFGDLCCLLLQDEVEAARSYFFTLNVYNYKKICKKS